LCFWDGPVENAGSANTTVYFSEDVTLTAHFTENYSSVLKIVNKIVLAKGILFFLIWFRHSPAWQNF
jgi:hypothetical protein